MSTEAKATRKDTKCPRVSTYDKAAHEITQTFVPTITLKARQGICISSAVACFLASSMLSRNRSSSMSSAFDKGSRTGNGHPKLSREHQSDTRACISLSRYILAHALEFR